MDLQIGDRVIVNTQCLLDRLHGKRGVVVQVCGELCHVSVLLDGETKPKSLLYRSVGREP